MDSRQQIESLLRLVRSHEDLKRRSISLVPTENLLSPLAHIVLSSDLVNRYFLLDNTIWEYPQTESILELVDIAETAIGSLFNARYVNLRPLSGLSCMTVVLAALTRPGDNVWSLSTNTGGHGATHVVARRLGLAARHIPVIPGTAELDLDECRRLADASPPSLIYFDHSNLLDTIVIEPLFDIVSDDTIIYYDCSHLFGLMLDPSFFDPRRSGSPLIGGSTHKTFPGPQKGAVMTDDPEIAERVGAVSDCFVSSHHLNSVAALGVTALEMLEFGCTYAVQLQRNALALGEALAADELQVQTLGGVVTRSHQVWIETPSWCSTPHEAVRLLREANLVVNCARIPTLNGAKGLRLGSTEVTRLGMKEDEMRAISLLLADVLHARREPSLVRKAVEELRSEFSSPRYCFASVDELRAKLGS